MIQFDQLKALEVGSSVHLFDPVNKNCSIWEVTAKPIVTGKTCKVPIINEKGQTICLNQSNCKLAHLGRYCHAASKLLDNIVKAMGK